MFKRTDPIQNRIRRAAILRLIYMAWQGEATPPDDPMTLNATVLTATMEQLRMLPSDAQLRTDLQYLEGKAALKVEWSKDGSGGFEWVRLTPSGVDLVEGTTSDPGILFSERR